MRITLALGSTLLVLCCSLVFLFGCSQQEFSTSSSEAYELYVQGHRQLMELQLEEAESSLSAAVALDPDFAMAHALLATAYYGTQQTALGKEAVVKAEDLAMTLSSDVERTKVQLMLCGLKNSKSARRDSLIHFLLEREPDNLLVLNAHGTALFDSDPAASEEIFKRIIEIDENFSPAYNKLGYLAAHDGRFQEAEDYLVKYAFKAGDSVANPHDSLGEILAMAGKYDEAEDEFIKALEIQPHFYHSVLHLGMIYLEQGRFEKGQAILDKLVDTDLGENVHYGEEVGQFVIRSQLMFELEDEAKAGIRAFVEDHPSSFVNLFYRAILSAWDGDFEAGERTFEAFMNEATTKAVQSGNVSLQRRVEAFRPQYDAIIGLIREDHPATVEAWTRFREMTEEDTSRHEQWRLQLNHGQALLLAGRPAEALEQAKLSLDPNPNRIYPMLLLMESAMALNEHGLVHDASKALKVLLARADEDLPVQQRYRDLKATLTP